MTIIEVLVSILTPEEGWTLRFLLRVVISSALLYAYVLVLARLFGSRTFASFTSYDFLTNIAAGSLVASAIMGPNIVEGVLGLTVLVLLQLAVSGAASRWRWARAASDNSPVVLVAHGELQREAMRRARVSSSTLSQHLRQAGVTDISGVRYAVLESGGAISVIAGDASRAAEWAGGLPPPQLGEA